MNYRSRLTIVFIILLFILPKEVCKAQQDYTVEHFDIDNGLPSSLINCILKDRFGYLWIGTDDGLCKFDGYQFKIYLQGTGANQIIFSIIEDHSGNLWVGTPRGLDKYNRITDSFTQYLLPIDTTNVKTSYEAPGIQTICEDRNENFWIGTRSALYNFNIKKGIFTLVKDKSGGLNKLNGKYIGVIYRDKIGNLWIGTGSYLRSDGGLNLFDPSSGAFKQFVHDPSNSESLQQNWVTSIYQDRPGNLWIGTNDGLDKFDFANQNFIHFKHDDHNPNSLSSDAIKCISEDDNGNLLIGTWAGGLDKYNLKSGKYSVYSLGKNEVDNKNINVLSLYVDHSGIIWAGTFNDGLYKIVPRSKSFLRAQNSVKNSERIGNTLNLSINAMYRNNKGVIWIGSSDGVKSIKPDLSMGPSFLKGISGLNNSIFKDNTTNKLWFGSVQGLYVIDLKTKKFVRYLHDPHNPNSISDNQITSIAEDSKGVIWLGTFGQGIEKYDRNGGTFKHFPLNPPGSKSPSFKDEAVFSMLIDNRGFLWIGTYKGLAKFNLSNETFKWYYPHSNNVDSLWYYYVFGIIEDHNGVIWLATAQGLVRYNRKSDTFNVYGKSNNLADEAVYSLLEDKHGNIWVATNNRISMFNFHTRQFKNFGKNYELIKSYLYDACKDSSGNLYFGNYTGISIFNPDSLYSDNPAPPIALTDFKISDRSVKLDSSISVKKNIELSYQHNEFSIEFSALNFINSYQNQYAYKLEGFDKDWIYCGTRHQATYMNLNYGTYTFRVIGSNSDEIWNKKGASLTITILPPWWRTTWAYISYGFFIVFSLYGLRKYELNRVQLKDKIKLDEAVLKEKVETDKIKSRFFANISHEFRTPLTLILGPAEKIISDSSDDVKKEAGIIKKNSKRLLQLVNQLLDLSKLEAGKLKLEASKNNIVSFVKGIALSFESLFEEKDITLKIVSEKDLIEVYFDKEKMIKVFSNILSNAFKFTPKNGRIVVLIKECHAEPALPAGRLDSASFINEKIPGQARNDNMKGFVEIKIRDTGIGIPQEEIPKLFDRFYQVDSSFTKEYQGTGIGLALAKELVELHHGTISVESEIGRGTEFIVCLPLGKKHLKEEEIEFKGNTVSSEADNLILSDTEEDYKNINSPNEISADEDKTIILIVEDNYDMREYIKEILDKNYNIEEAINGEQGIRKAESIIPDLIISDLMMPKMDGNEMTRILKNNEKTSHIPVIILTAKTGQENKLEGLETGADDYLTKPFDIKELQIRIKNLINLRKKLQEKLSKVEMGSPVKKENESSLIQAKSVKLRSIDKRFLDKIREIINEHLSEEDFSTEEIGRKLGMSYTQVYRKIKALTGKSPSLFVRSVRLLKAKVMIENGEGNISEIAYSVGFSSPVYFSKCFKEEFGYPPKNFIV
jgi:signal transduction histidine kinase/ligand-binding sensor domain-containing protein/DNA-binding response OmpR family regulator